MLACMVYCVAHCVVHCMLTTRRYITRRSAQRGALRDHTTQRTTRATRHTAPYATHHAAAGAAVRLVRDDGQASRRHAHLCARGHLQGVTLCIHAHHMHTCMIPMHMHTLVDMVQGAPLHPLRTPSVCTIVHTIHASTQPRGATPRTRTHLSAKFRRLARRHAAPPDPPMPHPLPHAATPRPPHVAMPICWRTPAC